LAKKNWIRQLTAYKTKEDSDITANNHEYFGDPVYEYTLIQAQDDGYLAACEIIKRKATIDSKTFTKAEILAAKPIDIRTGMPLKEEDLTKDLYSGRDFDNELLIDMRTPAMCADRFKLLCENGGPEHDYCFLHAGTARTIKGLGCARSSARSQRYLSA
jgi:type I restriction enzyme, R subunit